MSNIKGLGKLQSKLDTMTKNLDKKVIAQLEAIGKELVDTIRSKVAVDTGNLKSTIQYRIEGNKVIIFTDCDYAGAVEFGTVTHRAQPYMYPSIQEQMDDIKSNMNNVLKQLLGGV